jgi:hypothetical protein
MKKKDYAWSIVLNAFLAYLWVLFAKQMYQYADKVHNNILGLVIIGVGTALFWAIENRNMPFKEYNKLHPINLVGTISAIAVVLIMCLWFNMLAQ